MQFGLHSFRFGTQPLTNGGRFCYSDTLSGIVTQAGADAGSVLTGREKDRE